MNIYVTLLLCLEHYHTQGVSDWPLILSKHNKIIRVEHVTLVTIVCCFRHQCNCTTEFIVTQSHHMVSWILVEIGAGNGLMPDGTGSSMWNPSPWRKRTCLSDMVNIMPADDMVTKGARASAAKLLTKLFKNIATSAAEELMTSTTCVTCPIPYLQPIRTKSLS